jgi:hypothetical protein
MSGAQLLTDAFGRIKEIVHGTVAGLSTEQLAARLDPQANSIGWLVWHLTRIQDDHLADAAGLEQVYARGWWERLGRPYGQRDHGYGHSTGQVAQLQLSATDLLGYHDAVSEQSIAYLGGLADRDFERIVDFNWDPPVTLGVRLISVVSDDLQHAGQASFIRGVLERR